jgi:hypothetical protein
MSLIRRSLSYLGEQLKPFFPLGIIMFLGEKEHFSLGNLGPFPRKIHCSLGKYFLSRNFSYSMGNLFETSI